MMIRGDWKKSELTQVNYILGEDLKRHKLGLEIAHWQNNDKKTRGVFQMMQESARIDEKESTEPMAHFLFALERILSNEWTTRLEVGLNDQDTKTDNPAPNPQTAFIPVQQYAGWMNFFQFSSHLFLNFHLVSSTQTGFTTFFTNLSWQFSKAWQFHAYIINSLGRQEEKAKEELLARQIDVPNQYGLGFRSEF